MEERTVFIRRGQELVPANASAVEFAQRCQQVIPRILKRIASIRQNYVEVKKMSQPEKKFANGAVSASIFVNQGKGKDGKPYEIRKVVLQKRYKDNNDEWQSSNSYDINDLPKVIAAVQKAYDYLTSKEAQ